MPVLQKTRSQSVGMPAQVMSTADTHDASRHHQRRDLQLVDHLDAEVVSLSSVTGISASASGDGELRGGPCY